MQPGIADQSVPAGGVPSEPFPRDPPGPVASILTLGERDRMNDIWKAINQIAGGHSNLRLAIHKREDLNEKNDDEWTPYMWAVRCGLQDAADELKDAGADTSGHFDAALLNAVLNNDLQRGIHALKNGANPNRRFAGSSIIGCAASHGLDQLVVAMIAHGAKIESEMLFEVCHWETADWKVDSQEHVAAFANVVRAFLDAGADPSVRNADGQTPLEAIEGDGLSAVEAVLRNAQQDVPPNA